MPHLAQNRDSGGLVAPHFEHVTLFLEVLRACASLLASWEAFRISSLAFSKAFRISSAAVWKASFTASQGSPTPAAMPYSVLLPHFGQKKKFSSTFCPQFEQ